MMAFVYFFIVIYICFQPVPEGAPPPPHPSHLPPGPTKQKNVPKNGPGLAVS
jgi:hypothetical protein